MDSTLFAPADAAARTVLAVLAVRSFPVVVAFSGAEACSVAQRASALTAYTLVAYFAFSYANFAAAELAFAYAFFIAAALVVHAVSRRSASKALIFVLSVLVFMGAPAFAEGRLKTLGLLLGWDAMLSAYSYCVTQKKTTHVLEYLFFVFVNPVLVYPHRGTAVAPVGLNARGLLRVALGALVMFGAQWVSGLDALTPTGPRLPLGLDPVAGGVRLVRLYAAHSGLASIQIGLVRQLGLRVPERYDYPLLASSPSDFWQRWNTYVGNWARVYVFVPFARRLRKWTFGRGTLGAALALFAAFASMGLLHDLNVSLAYGGVHYFGTEWFVLNACIVVTWDLLARLFERNAPLHRRVFVARALFLTLAATVARGVSFV